MLSNTEKIVPPLKTSPNKSPEQNQDTAPRKQAVQGLSVATADSVRRRAGSNSSTREKAGKALQVRDSPHRRANESTRRQRATALHQQAGARKAGRGRAPAGLVLQALLPVQPTPYSRARRALGAAKTARPAPADGNAEPGDSHRISS